MKGKIGDYEKHRVQGTGLRAQRKKLRAQGTGLRAQSKRLRDEGTARLQGRTTARQCIMYYRRCIIGDVLH
jgi:hypothetical protein